MNMAYPKTQGEMQYEIHRLQLCQICNKNETAYCWFQLLDSIPGNLHDLESSYWFHGVNALRLWTTLLAQESRNNLSAVLTFIDFQKVFNSINQNKMKILKAYGIQPNLRAIEAMYTDARAVVVTPDGETEEFWHLGKGSAGRHTGPLPLYHSTGLCTAKSDKEWKSLALPSHQKDPEEHDQPS